MGRIKDSGKREEMPTGSVRDLATHKGMPGLIGPIIKMGLSMLCESGCAKYGLNNWAKGQKVSRFLDSADRHIVCFAMGDESEPHIWQAIWNLTCAAHTVVMCKVGLLPQELNDIPYKEFRVGIKIDAIRELLKEEIFGIKNKEGKE